MAQPYENFLLAISSTVIPYIVSQDTSKPMEGVGNVATNLMEPVSIVSGFVQSACFAIGGAFLLASIIKYFEHKRSPLMVPISTVIFLIVTGILLILLPFASYLTNTGLK